MASLMSGLGGRLGGGTLAGAPASNWSASFGGIPQIPNPGATAAGAIASNLANLGQINALTGGLNSALAGQARSNVAAGLPDYADMVSQSSKNISSNLKGQVPSDVITNLIQQAAERGIITGTTGSPNSNASYLRALGLTSLGLQQYGEQALTNAIGRTPQPQLVRPESFLVSPEQTQEAQYAANTMAAAPIPSWAATAGLGAAKSGLHAGLGAVSAPAAAMNNPFAPANYVSNPFAPASGGFGPPEVAMSATPGTAEPVQDPYTNWANWASSLPQSASVPYFDEDWEGNE